MKPPGRPVPGQRSEDGRTEESEKQEGQPPSWWRQKPVIQEVKRFQHFFEPARIPAVFSLSAASRIRFSDG
jgi:hypothetical protein